MKTSFLFVFSIFTWATWAQNIDQLFHLAPAGTAGSCIPQQNILQEWITDTATLVNYLIPRMTFPNYQQDLSLRSNLASWFSIRTNKGGTINATDKSKFNTVLQTLQAVQSFLNMQNPLFTVENQNGGTGVPYLFCDSTWQTETELAFDEDGNAILDDQGQQKNLRTMPRLPATPGNSAFNDLLEDMQKGTSPNWDKFAYYSSTLRDYLLEESAKRYLGTPPSWCNPPPGGVHFALTETNLLRDVITICPVSFTTTAEPFETIELGIVSPEATTPGTPLEATSPRGLTLFHEIIHMVMTPDKTPDKGIKPTQCLAATLKGIDAVANPDSIVFFAWSYYLEKNGNPTLKWHNGFSAV